MIRNHLRANAIGYLALFVALSGTAVATHPGGADTISSGDIIQGEVRSTDLSNTDGVRSLDVRDDTLADGGLAAVDLAQDSVGGSELVDDAVGRAELLAGAVGTTEIGANQVLGRNIAVGAVDGGKIATDSISGNDIATDAVDRLEIEQDAVGFVEIATDSVGGAELATGSVTSGELGSVVQREGLGLVEDAVAHDGIWAVGTEDISCNSGEIMLSVTMNWTDAGIDVNHGEKAFAGAQIDPSGSVDTATVQAVFDGGGGSADAATFSPVATCLAP